MEKGLEGGAGTAVYRKRMRYRMRTGQRKDLGVAGSKEARE